MVTVPSNIGTILPVAVWVAMQRCDIWQTPSVRSVKVIRFADESTAMPSPT